MSFILQHMEDILAEWDAFAQTQTPAAAGMDAEKLRDHAREMLEAIAADVETAQSSAQQDAKSKGLKPPAWKGSAAAMHGKLRHQSGFDLRQLVAEFRALRASVLRIWLAQEGSASTDHAYEIARFNEAIDEALADSVSTYSTELERSRETFLGILGHDLRTPLGSIWGATELLAVTNDQATRVAARAAAGRSITAMRRMIEDLLEFTRSRLGTGIPVQPAEGDLEELCRGALEEAMLAYPGTSFDMTSEGDLHGRFDADRLRQVVLNLLGNAVQHGRPGTPVHFKARGDDDRLEVRVINYGDAIAPAQFQAIFEPLVQLGTRATRSTNLGLGLFIAREIVEAHAGKIEVSSSTGAGTCFTVDIPRAGPGSESSGATRPALAEMDT